MHGKPEDMNPHVFILTGVDHNNERQVMSAFENKNTAIRAARIAGHYKGKITMCPIYSRIDHWINDRERNHKSTATNEPDTASDPPQP